LTISGKRKRCDEAAEGFNANGKSATILARRVGDSGYYNELRERSIAERIGDAVPFAECRNRTDLLRNGRQHRHGDSEQYAIARRRSESFHA
jgi:hypothetical protein